MKISTFLFRMLFSKRYLFKSVSVLTSKQLDSVGPDLLEGIMLFKNFKNKTKNEKIAMHGDDIVFGVHPVNIALNSNKRKIHRLLLCETDENHSFNVQSITKTAEKSQVKIEKVSKSVLDRLVGNAAWNPHQGVVLDCNQLPVNHFQSEKDFAVPKDNLIPVLANIIDPMNVGAILRSAYFFGCKSIILTADCSKISSTVSKASSGAMEAMNIYTMNQKLLMRYLNWLQQPENKCAVIATAGSGETSNTSASQSLDSFVNNDKNNDSVVTKVVIVFGNEGRGLPESVVQIARHSIVIPSQALPLDNVHSLNVSVAAGIILYQCSKIVSMKND